jgi:hypothetical protein
LLLSLAAAFFLLGTGAYAQQEAGTMVAVEGEVTVVRAGAAIAASPGTAVRAGDHVRTGETGRARISFLDHSTLSVAESSTIVIDEHVFRPDEGAVRSVINLLGGKVRALVSDYYGDPQASYEIETPTAVSGVRGTDFIVRFASASHLTEIVGLSGRVAVNSVLDRSEHGVVVGAREISTVARGGFPSQPRTLTSAELGFYLQGLEPIGAGAVESMMLRDPLIDQGEIPAGDEAPASSPGETAAPNTESPSPVEKRGSPSDVTSQPPVIIEKLGEIGVDFSRPPPGRQRK